MELGKLTRLVRHWIWLAPLVIGVVFVGAGIYMAVEGRNAHNDVRDSVLEEGITVSGDAPAFGGERVDSAAKADAQSEAILEHTLAATGGYLYAEMGRFFMPVGNYILPNGTYLTEDGGTTTDEALAALDDNGNPINYTTDESQAALNANDQPIRAFTSDGSLAAKDAEGNNIANSLRDTAQTSAFLRTSLGVAVMGFKVSDLVVGVGAFMIVIGAAFVVFIAPAIYYSAEVANHYDKLIKEEEGAKQPAAGAQQTT